ncbi:type II toxin-antitoxin system HipA family toxin [Fibrobacter sp. UWEL]|uniref:type II toxin-antitoxin system HipA family toxin n=1 Tax=Fibrobacter sp. UWEL TaxID=1896209 RepID=UPI00090ED49C|nr:type II toxin-antitoxin system HipA family toxin [Fibrobacter sp. UWEL]SHL50790.1 serine/threonine-protein kinase HipA [Fibrobacter sp. UWEL]
MILNVFFGSRLAGTLESTPNQGIIFQYNSEFAKTGPSLSQALPLQSAPFSQKECLPFFSGILPEGDVKRRVSDFLHISESSTFKLLQELGGDCAGMISILPESTPVKAQDTYTLDTKNYLKISDRKLLEFIQNSATRPLLKATEELRLSLAGAQEKLPLAFFGGKFYLPKDGAPSTHIIKPTGTGELASLAANEYICTQLAKSAGLPTPRTELRKLGDHYFFMTERYDRLISGKNISRLHQEDMCQALGIMSDRKYQNDGGPSLAGIYQLIKQKTSIPLLDTKAFIQYALFNLLIGNCDAHGKNYSLLYRGNMVQLAPIYDTVCTLIYPSLTQKTSMKFGKHYEIKKIKKDDLELWATEVNLRPGIFLDIYKELGEKIKKGFEPLKNDPAIADFKDTLTRIQESFFLHSLL